MSHFLAARRPSPGAAAQPLRRGRIHPQNQSRK